MTFRYCYEGNAEAWDGVSGRPVNSEYLKYKLVLVSFLGHFSDYQGFRAGVSGKTGHVEW